jgi:hypothetical protein
MRTDSEIECLSEMPADGIAAATTKLGLRHVPLAALPQKLHHFRKHREGATAGFGTKATLGNVRFSAGYEALRTSANAENWSVHVRSDR